MSDPDLEGENYRVVPGDEDVPVLILCEHAGNEVPADVDLGAPRDTLDSLLDSHWGWDRWAWETLSSFARPLGITTIGSRVSRMVLDVNRRLDQETLCRPDAGGVPLHGNRRLTDVARQARIERLHTPYHAACERELVRTLQRHGRVLLLSFHSFTGTPLGDEDRDFEVGVLFDTANEAWAVTAERILAEEGLRTRLNEPYSGMRGEIFSVALHGHNHGVPYLELETNQDVLEVPAARLRVSAAYQRAIPRLLEALPD
jgi:predicted N-formylglutamate amidohydrolase